MELGCVPGWSTAAKQLETWKGQGQTRFFLLASGEHVELILQS